MPHTEPASQAPSRHRRLADRWPALAAALPRCLVAALSVPLGLVLLEFPWNPSALAMEPSYLFANLAILALVFAVVHLMAQRGRVASAVFALACLLAGVANAFVVLFKGQPIVPADLLALGTAASVSGGYAFWPTVPMLLAVALFAAWCLLLYRMPWPPKPSRGRGEGAARVGCNLAAAALVAMAGAALYEATDIREAHGCTVDVWDARGSYARQGTALCFLERMQELTPSEPERYSAALADELRDTGATSEAEAAAVGDIVRPHVIAIMNETFSDLSRYPGLEGSNAAPELVRHLAGRDAIGGTTVVSALGGGTCNSEFEFLTGASLGNLGGGAYPYVLYDFHGEDSLVSAFKGLGYATRAIHPAEAGNWGRSGVYGRLGFDTFDDIATFKAQPGYEEGLFRNLVSDRTTYDLALAMIDEAEEPQFVFDVTIQNHGGYETQLVPEDQRVTLDVPELRSDEMDEFLSCIRASERDLAYLLGELERRDAPVVVCFFGDHQPGFSDRLFESTYGTSVEGVPLDQVQQRFSTPYLIWGNKEARLLGLADRDKVRGGTASLNYLGAMLMEACGLPPNGYQAFLQGLRERVPAINMNGYLGPDGLWRWFDQDGGVGEELWAYQVVQHRSLFG